MFRATFRAAAAGRTSREFITSSPTQVMDRVTTTAMATENTVSCQNTRTPRLSARAGWTAESISWLKEASHSRTTSSRIRASSPTLAGSTDRISPTRRALNLVKDRPLRVDRKMPRATAVEENTPITVSLARAARRLTTLNNRANSTAKTTAAQVGSWKPHRAPMAMPVNAE